MEVGLGNVVDWILYFMFIFLRVISTFALSPIFGKSMPAVAKIVLSLCLSAIVMMVLPPEAPTKFNTLIEFVVVAGKEIILGLMFSFIVLLFMYAIYVAGKIIDLQIGFSFAQIYDPITGNQSPITGTFLNILIVLIFFATDSHLLLFQILYDTFSVVPPGSVVFNTNVVKIIMTSFILMFEIGIKMAMPILVTSLLTEILLGVIMKTIQGVNFFVIGFPIKIFMGFIILIAVIPIMSNVAGYIFDTMYTVIQKLFEELGGVTGG